MRHGLMGVWVVAGPAWPPLRPARLGWSPRAGWCDLCYRCNRNEVIQG